MRVKIRVHQDLVPSSNKSYPGGATEVLQAKGASNFHIPYTDGMPIYCDVAVSLCVELKQADWIESIRAVADPT